MVKESNWKVYEVGDIKPKHRAKYGKLEWLSVHESPKNGIEINTSWITDSEGRKCGFSSIFSQSILYGRKGQIYFDISKESALRFILAYSTSKLTLNEHFVILEKLFLETKR